MSKQKIIVTGGMGYIGSHTVVELIAAGYHPVIADNLSNADMDMLDGMQKITGTDIAFEKVEFTDSKATIQFFEHHRDAIGVIHFAALKSVGESVEQALKYYHNNVGSLINVIEAMRRFEIRHMIFSSSCTVYGQATTLPVTEDTPFQPAASPYGNTKQISEHIIRDVIHSDAFPFSAISLRYFNPIGAHPSALIGEKPVGIPNNLLPYITQTAIGIRVQLKVFGNDYNTKDGTCIRDYIHVSDLATAHVKSLDRLISSDNASKYEIFNLGTGQGHSVLEVINSFEKTSGITLNYTFAERRPGDVESIYADCSKANNLLGWHTQYNLDDMTSTAWAWEEKRKK